MAIYFDIIYVLQIIIIMDGWIFPSCTYIVWFGIHTQIIHPSILSDDNSNITQAT
jgi:hypothetical protein